MMRSIVAETETLTPDIVENDATSDAKSTLSNTESKEQINGSEQVLAFTSTDSTA